MHSIECYSPAIYKVTRQSGRLDDETSAKTSTWKISPQADEHPRYQSLELVINKYDVDSYIKKG